jgi:tRNA (mo5U34)-methyltransferase
MMSPDDLRAGVKALQPWFHQIDLGHGVFTKTQASGTEPVDHPRETWEIIKRYLPTELPGRSVLDVGCNAGFYAVEAKRRGAFRVLGIDAQRHPIRQAQFVARALDLDIEYKRMSVYDLSGQRNGKFDVTLALGLIYHCKHVLLALERLFEVTGGMMILESAVFAPERLFESFSDSSSIGRRIHALAYIENDSTAREAVYNWFIPTADCLMGMLRDTGFVEPKLVSEAKGRAVIICSGPGAGPDSLSAPQLLAANLRLLEGPISCGRGDRVRFRLKATNTGQSVWLCHGNSQGKGAVRLGIHLLDEAGREIAGDYGGAKIEQRVIPGGESIIDFIVTAPSQPGTYQLKFDMVSELVTWFEDADASVPLVHNIRVE